MIQIPEFIQDSHKLSKACLFAAIAHGGQQRKYTFEPYIYHPIAVAGILRDFGIHNIPMLQGALLHDVLEDTDATFDEIRNEFGFDVAMYVQGLSKASLLDDAEGNRQQRHEYDLARIAEYGPQVHTIKCADIAHNALSIIEHDKVFAKVWLVEKKAYLDVLDRAHNDLWVHASQRVIHGLTVL